jgi:hypothetical protein
MIIKTFRLPSKEKNNYKVSAFFFENNYYLWKVVPKAAQNICFGFPYLSLVDFLQCAPCHRVTGSYLKAGTRFLKEGYRKKRLLAYFQIRQEDTKLYISWLIMAQHEKFSVI